MMGQRLEHAESLINAIAAKYALVDQTDLSILADIMQHFELLSQEECLPSAFRSFAERCAQLAERMIMEETPFEKGARRLGQCVSKAQASFSALREERGMDEATLEEDDPSDSSSEAATAALADDSEPCADTTEELLKNFASQQKSVIEDFEAHILAVEQGTQKAAEDIRRILHTWKGEFGVLGLQGYSSLIHQLEEQLDAGSLHPDTLLRLKDLLAVRLARFASGQAEPMRDAEIEAFLSDSRSQATAPAEPEAAPDNSAAQQDMVPTSGERAFSGDPSLMGDFVAESREHLDAIEPLLLDLESEPTRGDCLNSIFRACHTIKGVAGFLGLGDVSQLAHSMESLMDLARKGELLLSGGHIDALLQGVDCMRRLVDSVEAGIDAGSYTVPENFGAVLETLGSPYTIGIDGEAVEPTSARTGDILVARGEASKEAVDEAIARQQQGDARRIGEILIGEGTTNASSVAGALASQNAAKQSKNIEDTIRVPVQRLDQLIDAIGEAVIAQSMVYADPALSDLKNLTLENKMAQASLIMREIQELSMSLRMVSVKGMFQKMARLVRDLSRKVGKDIELTMDGEDTELDKTVVENIGDPLMHMIRNAIDHGIETAEERRASGKSPRATVALRAYHKAGNVFIEISDDGRGLDREKILAKARQVGIHTGDDSLADEEVFRYIFMPGFSTASKVTDVSGRGVGMDVVKKNIEALRGAVDITSQPGNGTTFTIRLPLTLAIISGMVVRIDGERYILPSLAIIESVNPRPGQVERMAARGEIIKVRGELLRMVRLKQLFFGTGGNDSPEDGIAVIVEDVMGRRCALLIDEILDQQQVVIKSLGEGMGTMRGLAGGAIMNDGSVSLILDVGGILRMADGHEQ
jgi:two-component system chemotaxis sensor kinase CheA